MATKPLTYQQIDAFQAWREDLIQDIQISVNYTGAGTTIEEDRAIAEQVFEDLLRSQQLVLPEAFTPDGELGGPE